MRDTSDYFFDYVDLAVRSFALYGKANSALMMVLASDKHISPLINISRLW